MFKIINKQICESKMHVTSMYFYLGTCALVEIKGDTDAEIRDSCLHCGISPVAAAQGSGSVQY